MEINTRIFSYVRDTFGLQSSRFGAAGVLGMIQDKAKADDWKGIDTIEKFPVVELTEEERERQWYFNQGQRLARQEDWEKLGSMIQDFDQIRATTQGGILVADLLASGARADVVEPIEQAISSRLTTPPTEGLEQLQEVLLDHPDNYGVALVVALAHIDTGWAWHDHIPEKNPHAFLNTFRRHFQIAQVILNKFSALEENSAALAAAQCALLAASNSAVSRINDDYQDLIDLDPTNARHIRSFGLHLLPCWFGSYEKLKEAADNIATQTADIWGQGGYTWMYFDALAADQGAFRDLDVARFIAGLKDIASRKTDQHSANLIAAYCGLTMGEPAEDGEPIAIRRKRSKIVQATQWIIEHHLREVHPVIWAEAANRFADVQSLAARKRMAKVGEEHASRILARRFERHIRFGRPSWSDRLPAFLEPKKLHVS